MEKCYAQFLIKQSEDFKEFGDLNNATLNDRIYLIGRVMSSTMGNVSTKNAVLEVLSKNDEAMRIPLEFTSETITKDFVLF